MCCSLSNEKLLARNKTLINLGVVGVTQLHHIILSWIIFPQQHNKSVLFLTYIINGSWVDCDYYFSSYISIRL